MPIIYKIISHWNTDIFEQTVSQYLNDGYILAGGVSYSPYEENKMWWCQAVIKKIENNNYQINK